MTVKDLLKITDVRPYYWGVKFFYSNYDYTTFMSDRLINIWYKGSCIYTKKIKDILNEGTKKDN